MDAPSLEGSPSLEEPENVHSDLLPPSLSCPSAPNSSQAQAPRATPSRGAGGPGGQSSTASPLWTSCVCFSRAFICRGACHHTWGKPTHRRLFRWGGKDRSGSRSRAYLALARGKGWEWLVPGAVADCVGSGALM